MDQYPQAAPSFLVFFRTLLFTPSKFFRQYLAPGVPRPYWAVAIIVLLLNSYLELLYNVSLSAYFERVSSSIYVNILLFGLLRYTVGAWGMQLKITICGGTANTQQARRILLYSTIPSTLTNSYLLFFESILGVPISSEVFILWYIIIFCYEFYVEYCAFMAIPGTKSRRVMFFIPLHLISSVLFFSVLTTLSRI